MSFENQPAAWTRTLLFCYLLLCVGLFAALSARWKQVNDPVQLHYACFLMDHGMALYRDILEINLPGTYLVNWTVIHTLGGGSVAWRLFDFGLMLVAAGAMIAIALPYDWLAGVLSAALFILYHGKDGAGQEGQRDLIIAVLLLCAYALVFDSFRNRRQWPLFVFGLCAGIAATIKPTPLPLTLLLLALAAFRWKRAGEPVVRPLLYAVAGLLIPFAVVVVFLAKQHSLGSFWYLLRVELPFYQMLGRKAWPKLFLLMLSPSVRILALFGVAIAMIRQKQSWETVLLATGILFGMASFLIQGKGFMYHRYPMLAFLFLWVAIELVSALRVPGIAGRVGFAGVAFALILLPVYLHVATKKVWAEQYPNALTADLNRLGGQGLSGHVQCLDMPSDCDATLYRMQLVQSTGLFYDYLIFGSGQQSVIRDVRARFWQEFQKNTPRVIVVGSDLFPAGLGYQKLASWPRFQQELASRYVLYEDRTFPRTEVGTRAYRIYVEKSEQPRATYASVIP